MGRGFMDITMCIIMSLFASNEVGAVSAKTERITILGSRDFKSFLTREAKKEGVSVSQLVRDRCLGKSHDPDEEILRELVVEVMEATRRAKKALNKGLNDARKTLRELHVS